MFIRLTLLLMCVILVSACGRTVDVIQKDKFTAMANRMPRELLARDILDSDGDYLAVANLSQGADFGNVLYNNLSPNFLFDHVAKNSMTTFPASVRANEKVNIHKYGFSIVNKNESKHIHYGAKVRRIDVDMVAITDWEGDGQQDWIIACRYVEKVGANARIYYLAIPSNSVGTGANTKLVAKVIAVYEDLGATGRMYLRESQAPEVVEKKVQHVVPGLKNVTEPPKPDDIQKKQQGTVKVKSL